MMSDRVIREEEEEVETSSQATEELLPAVVYANGSSASNGVTKSQETSWLLRPFRPHTASDPPQLKFNRWLDRFLCCLLVILLLTLAIPTYFYHKQLISYRNQIQVLSAKVHAFESGPTRHELGEVSTIGVHLAKPKMSLQTPLMAKGNGTELEKCQSDLENQEKECAKAKEKALQTCDEDKEAIQDKCDKAERKMEKEWAKERLSLGANCTSRVHDELFDNMRRFGTLSNIWLCSDDIPSWSFGYVSTFPLPSFSPARNSTPIQTFTTNFTADAILHFPVRGQPPARILGYEVTSARHGNGWWRMTGLHWFGGPSVAFQAKKPVFGMAEYGVKIYYIADTDDSSR